MGKYSVEKRERVSSPSLLDVFLRLAAGQATSVTAQRRRIGPAAVTDGATTGSFTAGVTNTLDTFNDSTETILVTSTTDTALAKGSEFEIVSLGYVFESVHSDIAGATAAQDVVTETLVTPFGDIGILPSFDVASQLIGDMFSVIADGNPPS
jgi:hypothetical protein